MHFIHFYSRWHQCITASPVYPSGYSESPMRRCAVMSCHWVKVTVVPTHQHKWCSACWWVAVMILRKKGDCNLSRAKLSFNLQVIPHLHKASMEARARIRAEIRSATVTDLYWEQTATHWACYVDYTLHLMVNNRTAGRIFYSCYVSCVMRWVSCRAGWMF